MTTPPRVSSTKVDGVLFDKDGTLFDYESTWNTWAANVIDHFADGQGDVMARLALAMDFDLEAGRFNPTSVVIAGTNREAAECVAKALPELALSQIEHVLMIHASQAPLTPAVPLAPFLERLSAHGLKLGVMTNDSEFGARSHLQSAGVAAHFDFIAGFDSGHGAKPDPGPLLAFARDMRLTPDRVVMVGDSAHDLIAGRAAGMQTVGVLTGMAGHDELAALADIVFPDIGHLSDWIMA